MRLRIDTSEVKFRVASTPQPKTVSRADRTQRTLPDGRPVWTMRLTAIDAGANSTESIWVEVAGEEPKLTLDELAQVHGLTFAPWVDKQKNQIVRSFRADAVSTLAEARRPQAAA